MECVHVVPHPMLFYLIDGEEDERHSGIPSFRYSIFHSLGRMVHEDLGALAVVVD
jgi:hypothetical protein